MTVTCEACGTSNRDKAMFCKGCLARLPAFVPTPVDALKPGPATAVPRKGAFRRSQEASDEGRIGGKPAVRHALLMAMALLVLGFVWIAWSLAVREPEPQPSQVVPAVVKPIDTIAGGSGSSTRDSLGPGETLIEPGSPGRSERSLASASASAPAPAPEPPAAETSPTSRPPILAAESSVESAASAYSGETGRRPVVPTTRGRPLDPRQGCEHLFFAFAARCEANHCQQAGYARHPRCDIVRRQRLLEEGRRDAMPTS
jgi:hypothetical protein